MSVWSTYEGRLAAHGETKHDASFLREMRYINRKLPDNLSYQTVTIFDTAHSFNIESEAMVSASFEQNVAIINSDNLNEKYIFSMPQEELRCGCLIEWMDNHWILTELDANSTLYMRGKLLQCNHVLKWVNEKDEIIKQWCAVEDGTKLTHGAIPCNGLAYRKRCVITTPLIAGTPLEIRRLKRKDEIRLRVNAENIVYWAISSQDLTRVRFNDYAEDGSRDKRLEMGSPKPRKRHGEDIVCALLKGRGYKCTEAA